MKNFLMQVKFNYRRIVWRNKRFFFFSLALPVVFYLLFTKVMTVGVPASYLKTWQLNYLVSMTVYSSLISSVTTVSNTLLEDREHHFALFVRLTGAKAWRYYAGMLAVFLPLTVLAIVVLGLAGFLINGVSLTPTLWLIFVLLLPLLSLPLVLLGILISQMGTANLVNILNNIALFFLAIVGGLWWPVELLPTWLQRIGRGLPTYQISTIIQEVVHKNPLKFDTIVGLFSWTLLLWGLLWLSARLMKQRALRTI